jgi:thiol-disulfide isomerase/thioredoxin
MIKYIFLFFSLVLYTQEDVPDEYWIDDSNFEDTISDSSAFGENNEDTILVEFWAEFNKVNCFADWQKIQDAKYYRVDIVKSPLAKKKYRIRMTPSLLIFKNGELEKSYKAGLDLLLPTSLQELQEDINNINKASQF